MEITKNQDNERLYTILMNDDEMKLYSEFKDRLKSIDSKKMLKNAMNPLKTANYKKKEDGTPDRLKNGLQNALSCALWA